MNSSTSNKEEAITSQQSFENGVLRLQASIKAMLEHRESYSGKQATSEAPSLWKDYCQIFSYLFSLNPTQLRNIRFHAWMIDGTGLSFYSMHYPLASGEAVAEDTTYKLYTKDLPERYILSEPQTHNLPSQFNFSIEYDERFINRSLNRHQISIANLYHSGVFDFLDTLETPIIMEIGAGYGGLSHGLKQSSPAATCLIVDLPEMLIFSATYLLLNNPDKRILVCDPDVDIAFEVSQGLERYDFVFAPNYRFHELDSLKGIPLFLNIQSFQEMTEEQVTEYLDFAQSHVSGYVYSDNLDRIHNNPSLSSVTTHLSSRFNLYPKPSYYQNLWKDETDLKGYKYYKRYLGYKESLPSNFNAERIHLPLV